MKEEAPVSQGLKGLSWNKHFEMLAKKMGHKGTSQSSLENNQSPNCHQSTLDRNISQNVCWMWPVQFYLLPWFSQFYLFLVSNMIKPEYHISTTSPLATPLCCCQLNCSFEDSIPARSGPIWSGKAHSCLIHQNNQTRKALAS